MKAQVIEKSDIQEEFPRGKVAIVMTDVEGISLNPKSTEQSLQFHDEILKELIAKYQGYEVRKKDFFNMIAFQELENSIKFCTEAQLSFLRRKWTKDYETKEWASSTSDPERERSTDSLRPRFGVHFGIPSCIKVSKIRIGRYDYFGDMVDELTTRIFPSAKGGEIIISESVYSQIRELKIVPRGAKIENIDDRESELFRLVPHERRIRSIYNYEFSTTLIRRASEVDEFDRIINRVWAEKQTEKKEPLPRQSQKPEAKVYLIEYDLEDHQTVHKYSLDFFKIYDHIISRKRRKRRSTFNNNNNNKYNPNLKELVSTTSFVFQHYITHLIFVFYSDDTSPLYQVPIDVLFHVLIPFIDEIDVFKKYNVILGPSRRIRELKKLTPHHPQDLKNFKNYYIGRLRTLILEEQQLLSRMMETYEILWYLSLENFLSEYTVEEAKFIVSSTLRILDMFINRTDPEIISAHFGDLKKINTEDELLGGNPIFFISSWKERRDSFDKKTEREERNVNLLVKMLRICCTAIDRFVDHYEAEDNNLILFEFFMKQRKINTFRIFVLYLYFCRSCYRLGGDQRRFFRSKKSCSIFYKNQNFIIRVLEIMVQFISNNNNNNSSQEDEECDDILDDVFNYYFTDHYASYLKNRSFYHDGEKQNGLLFDDRDNKLKKVVTRYFKILQEKNMLTGKGKWKKYDFHIILFLFEKKNEYLKYFDDICNLVKIWKVMISQDNNNNNEYVIPGLNHIWELLDAYRRKRGKEEEYEILKSIILVELYKISSKKQFLEHKKKKVAESSFYRNFVLHFHDTHARYYIDHLRSSSSFGCSSHLILFLPYHPVQSNDASVVHRIMSYFEGKEVEFDQPDEILENIDKDICHFKILYRFLKEYRAIILDYYGRDLSLGKSVIHTKNLKNQIEMMKNANIIVKEPQFEVPQGYLERLSRSIRIAYFFTELGQSFSMKRGVTRTKNFKKGVTHYTRKFLGCDLGKEKVLFELYDCLFEFNRVFFTRSRKKVKGYPKEVKYVKEVFLVKNKERFVEVCRLLLLEKMKILKQACYKLLENLFEGMEGSEDVMTVQSRILEVWNTKEKKKE